MGAGGHASAIAALLDGGGTLIGFDADEDALENAKGRLAGVAPHIECVHTNFRNVERELDALGVPVITKALFDLGWNAGQLEAGRGFSFQTDEPLLMTYDAHPPEGALTADSIVNGWSEESLANVFFGYGEERFARRIAKRIVEAREKRPIRTARELADIVKAAVPGFYARGRTHPATKVFQGLRIAVNDELGAIREGLRGAWKRLAPGGRIAVITFHSIEDREVKRLFQELEKAGEGERIFKKPLAPSLEEVRANPSARSAKLRVIQKTP